MHDLLPFLPGQLNQVLDGITLLIPELYLSGLFLVILVTDILFGKNSGWLCRILACAGLVVVLIKDLQQFGLVVNNGFPFFNEMLLLHRTSVTFKALIDIFAIILLLYFEWDDELRSYTKKLSGLYAIAIAAILGLHLMAMSINLLSIYLSIEMVSIASYLMVAYHTENKLSSEAGLKYVLFGAASSAVMLYGISLLYGFTGSLNLLTGNMLPGLLHTNAMAVSLAFALVFVGVGFKLSFVPMHFWVPDIYQGAPTPVSAFLSTVPKIATFCLLINFFIPFLYYPKWDMHDFKLALSAAGIVTMVAGNFAAVLQNNVKRMLAYSSIGHTGFALMALAAFNDAGKTALSFYLVAYSLASIGTWMLATYFADAAKAEDMTSYKGLGFKYPLAGVLFVILLISLTGIPLTAGFNGKLVVFSAAYSAYQQSHYIWTLLLMITGAVTTVVSLFYYIKIPLNLFLRKTERSAGFASPNKYLLASVAIITILVIYLGFFPDILLKNL